MIEVQRHIISNLTNSATQQQQFDGDKEWVQDIWKEQRTPSIQIYADFPATLSSEDEGQDEKVDFALAEIGSSSSEEEEESDENNYDNSSRVATCTRSGRRAHVFCYRLHKVKVDLVRRLIIPVISFSVGRVITFWAIQGKGYSFFLQEIEGGHKKHSSGEKNNCTKPSPPLINDKSLIE